MIKPIAIAWFGILEAILITNFAFTDTLYLYIKSVWIKNLKSLSSIISEVQKIACIVYVKTSEKFSKLFQPIKINLKQGIYIKTKSLSERYQGKVFQEKKNDFCAFWKCYLTNIQNAFPDHFFKKTKKMNNKINKLQMFESKF